MQTKSNCINCMGMRCFGTVRFCMLYLRLWLEDLTLSKAHSPLRPLLKISAKSPFMQALYLTFAFGAVIWCRYPTFGVAICVATAGVILFQVGFVSFLLLKFTRDTLQGDLRDIPKYYKLASLDGSDKTGGDFMPLGPRAFWVVEAKHRVTGETELAGCVGLGAF